MRCDRSLANANGNSLLSNEVAASVELQRDLLRERNVLMGRVVADDCSAPDNETASGVAGVRIYLENGTWVVSDEQGRFHFEGVRPGSHVVQIDLETLDPQYEPVICDEHSRFAGRPWSRFVDLQGGLAYGQFSEDNVRPTEYQPVIPLHFTLDNNVTPFMPCVAFQEPGREIVYAVVAEVLEDMQGNGLSRSGETADDDQAKFVRHSASGAASDAPSISAS